MIKLRKTAFLSLALSCPALAQSYVLDDGIANFSGGSSLMGSAGELGFCQAFDVPGGGVDQIESISAVLAPFSFSGNSVAGLNGAPVRVAVWDDPNGDGNPSDAVLLGVSSGHVSANVGSGQFQTFAFSSPVSVSGSFLIGASIELGQTGPVAVGAVDDSNGYQGDSWYYGNIGGQLDLASLPSNTSPPTNIFLSGRYMLRANDGDYGAPIGETICVSAPNSTGRSGELRATGYEDASAGTLRVVLAANRLPEDQFGFFVASKTTASPVTPPGSSGQLCLGGSILRIRSSVQMIQSGAMAHEVDLGNVDGIGPATPGVDIVSIGETWTIQAWHRDMDPGPTSNFSEALSVTFQ